MGASCNGEVRRDGHQWFCLACGHTSSAWSPDHEPLQSKAAHFIASLLELVREVEAETNVEAAAAA